MVSIIIPVYNTGKYLLDCVQSILQQTYTELECILKED
ncbi:MAG: glycosyltransferase [Clostridiales bacterium]|nr:glycosyltransferase [Clostridiales bacterium]